MGSNTRNGDKENPVRMRMRRKIMRVTMNVIVSESMMKIGSVGRSIRILDMINFLSRKTVDDLVTVFANAVHGTNPEIR